MSDSKITLRGTVICPPEVRTAIDGVTQRTVPILHIWLKVDGQDKPTLVQQSFHFNCREGAAAAARRYKRGSVLKIDVDMRCLQLTFTNAEHIHLVEEARHA